MRDSEILAVLTRPMKACQIAEALGINGSSLSFQLGSMARRGLVKSTGPEGRMKWWKL